MDKGNGVERVKCFVYKKAVPKIIMTNENENMKKMNELYEIIETAVRLDRSLALEERAVGKIHLQMINAT